MTNPLLAEINNLSPAAKAALTQAHASAIQTTPSPASTQLLHPPDASPSAAPMMDTQKSTPSTLLSPTPKEHTALPGMTPPDAPPSLIDQEQNELERKNRTGSGISQIHSKIENTGFGQKHPFLGKVLGWGAEIPARIADISASSVAPMVTANTPGTEYYHDRLVKQDQRQLGQTVEDAQKQAQTSNIEANTEAIPVNEQQRQEQLSGNLAQHGLRFGDNGEIESIPYDQLTGEARSQEDLRRAQIHNLLSPQAKTAFEAWQQQNPNAPVSDFLNLQAQGHPKSPEQQFIDEYQLNHKGSTIADAERAYSLTTQKPPQVAPVMMFLPNGQGGSTAQVVHPGQTVGPGAQTASGLNQSNTETSATRTMIERAPRVIDLAQRLKGLVNQQSQQLGPEAGRWNDFWSSKVGAPNPGFRQMMVDATLLRTALMQMHTGARGGEYIMKEFGDLLDTGKDSPQNMQAALDEIISYAHDVENQKPSGSVGNSSETQNSGNVRMMMSGKEYDIPADKVESMMKKYPSLKGMQ